MAVKKVSKKGKGSYADYKGKNKFAKNKLAKVLRHLRNHPNDAQTAEKQKAFEKGAAPTRSTNNKSKLVDKAGKVLDIKWLRKLSTYKTHTDMGFVLATDSMKDQLQKLFKRG